MLMHPRVNHDIAAFAFWRPGFSFCGNGVQIKTTEIDFLRERDLVDSGQIAKASQHGSTTASNTSTPVFKRSTMEARGRAQRSSQLGRRSPRRGIRRRRLGSPTVVRYPLEGCRAGNANPFLSAKYHCGVPTSVGLCFAMVLRRIGSDHQRRYSRISGSAGHRWCILVARQWHSVGLTHRL